MVRNGPEWFKTGRNGPEWAGTGASGCCRAAAGTAGADSASGHCPADEVAQLVHLVALDRVVAVEHPHQRRAADAELLRQLVHAHIGPAAGLADRHDRISLGIAAPAQSAKTGKPSRRDRVWQY